VADVISINNKLQLAEEKKTELIRKRKILAIQKVFHCTHCASKCAKCGIQISTTNHPREEEFKTRVPYRFCDGCSEEYLHYIDRLQGGTAKGHYWQNDAWLDLWKKWIDYQGTIDRYLKSKEFIQLLNEIKQIGFDK
jgi:Pyruvate/2-oxoacid:ferredoxin oxidoreductase delta subunit